MKANKKKKIIILTAVLVLVISIVTTILLLIDNKTLDFENYELKTSKDADTEIVIAQLSDLHFPKIKVDIDKLCERLKNEKVDIIAITGDIIDGRKGMDNSGLDEFIEKIIYIAPVYYVNGNHELFHKDRKRLYNKLTESGIIILHNKSENVTIKGKQVTLIGVSDDRNYSSEMLQDNVNAENNYKIMLSHRPEKWQTYVSSDNDILPNLVLTGHAHGGQVRFFGQGLYAPGQGWFPQFDSGIYNISEEKNINMIVSRGLGNSVIKNRFNNKPNVPIIKIAL